MAEGGHVSSRDGKVRYVEITTSTTATTVTNATGTITQVNYDENGAIEGFLLGTNILLSFPTNVSGGIGTLGAVGNTVTYSGTASTNSTTGFQTVRVTSFTNNTTHATYTSTTFSSTSTAYGPTSGSVKLLNYDSSGAPNSGFASYYTHSLESVQRSVAAWVASFVANWYALDYCKRERHSII